VTQILPYVPHLAHGRKLATGVHHVKGANPSQYVAKFVRRGVKYYLGKFTCDLSAARAIQEKRREIASEHLGHATNQDQSAPDTPNPGGSNTLTADDRTLTTEIVTALPHELYGVRAASGRSEDDVRWSQGRLPPR
jgi:hypothetical protein